MRTVFVVQHAHQLGESEEVKMIGVYTSETTARAAVERLSQQPGFQHTADGFSIDPCELDQGSWPEGFVTTMTVLVRLLEEGTDVWRPAVAHILPGELYEIQGPVPDEEVWEFPPGTPVKCETRTFDSGPALVAVARADAA
jgi:hypothetical protein